MTVHLLFHSLLESSKSKKDTQTVTDVLAGVFKKVLQPNPNSPPTSEAKKLTRLLPKFLQ